MRQLATDEINVVVQEVPRRARARRTSFSDTSAKIRSSSNKRPDHHVAVRIDDFRAAPEVDTVLEADAVAEDQVGAQEAGERPVLFAVHLRIRRPGLVPARRVGLAASTRMTCARPAPEGTKGQVPEVLGDEHADAADGRIKGLHALWAEIPEFSNMPYVGG
jgi:hypothetical protein